MIVNKIYLLNKLKEFKNLSRSQLCRQVKTRFYDHTKYTLQTYARFIEKYLSYCKKRELKGNLPVSSFVKIFSIIFLMTLYLSTTMAKVCQT